MSDDRIINRVKKLLALAADTAASDGERDNALRMAYATVAKYNLDMATIEGQSPDAPQEARCERRVECYGRPWAMDLAHSVAQLFFCKFYYMRWTISGQRDHVTMCFVGKESNAESAAEVTRVLIEFIFREAKRKMRQHEENVTWRRSFCTGAAFKIGDRVRELQRSTPSLEAPMTDEDGEEIPALEVNKQQARSTALVLVNLAKAEAEANDLWVKEQVGELRSVRTKRSNEIKSDAYSKGREFGSSLNLANSKKLT